MTVNQQNPPLNIAVVSSKEETRHQLVSLLSDLPFVGHVGSSAPQEYSGLKDLENSENAENAKVLLADFTGAEDTVSAVVENALSSRPDLFAIVLNENIDADIILSAIRAGASEFIQYPKDEASLLQILMRQYQQQVISPALSTPDTLPNKGTLLGIFSPKGGGGTTTLALNLGHQIHKLTEDKVVVVDLNPQYNTYEFLVGAEPKYALSDLLMAQKGHEKLDMDLLEKIITPSKAGISLLMGSKDIADETPPLTDTLVGSVLNALTQQFDWVLIDMPGQMVDECHQKVFEMSDEMMVVSMMDMPSLHRTRQYFDLAKLYLQPEKMNLVLNRYNLSAAFSVSNKKLEESFQYEVKSRLNNDWNTCVEAATLGEFLLDVKEKSPLVKDIGLLAKQLIQTYRGLNDGDPNEREGLFSKIKSMMG